MPDSPPRQAQSAPDATDNLFRAVRELAAELGIEAGFLSFKLHAGMVKAPQWGRTRPSLLAGPQRRGPRQGAVSKQRLSDAEVADRFAELMKRLLEPFRLQFGSLALEIRGGEVRRLTVAYHFRNTPSERAALNRVLLSLVA